MEQKHLLVIEDDAAVCELLAGALGRPDCRVTTVHSGEDGLALIEEDPPQLVILDVTLPGMNGLDVCRTMRRDPWMEKIPVLMLTGRDEDDDIVAGLDVGADDYMTKPFALKVLSARVNALLRRGRTAGTASPAAAREETLLEVRSLGRCELQFGNRVVPWAEGFSPAQRMLLAVLLAAPNRRVSQEAVQLGFWPDSPASRARSNFDSLMTRLRKTLEQVLPGIDVRHHLQLSRGIICLENVRIDAHEFRRLAGKGLQQAAAGDLWPAEISLSAAFSLWQGTFLPGDFGSESAAVFQDELEQLYLEASQRFARILAESRRYQEAIKLLRYALRYNPTHDGITRLLYQLLAADDQRVQAKQLLDQYARSLAREKFSAEEIRSVLGDFPQDPPKNGWLKG
ncbi:MAG: response regulator [Deltaproteobacteria bacterium]|nr:MAG: response regulator [Deltaproteobacteria bacterium]